MRVILAATLAVAAAAPATAQTFGDTQLSYQNGVVYDDDLVPGRGPNTSFLVEEQAPEPSGNQRSDPSFGSASNRPANSPNLIGSDGRAARGR